MWLRVQWRSWLLLITRSAALAGPSSWALPGAWVLHSGMLCCWRATSRGSGRVGASRTSPSRSPRRTRFSHRALRHHGVSPAVVLRPETHAARLWCGMPLLDFFAETGGIRWRALVSVTGGGRCLCSSHGCRASKVVYIVALTWIDVRASSTLVRTATTTTSREVMLTQKVWSRSCLQAPFPSGTANPSGSRCRFLRGACRCEPCLPTPGPLRADVPDVV